MSFLVTATLPNATTETLPVVLGVYQTKEQAKNAVKMQAPNVMNNSFFKVSIHKIEDKTALASFKAEDLKSFYDELVKAQERQQEINNKLRQLQQTQQELQSKINEQETKYPGISALPPLKKE